MRIARLSMLVGCLALVATPACDKKAGDAKPAAVKKGDKKAEPPAPTAKADKADKKAPAAPAAAKKAPAPKTESVKQAGGTGAAVKAADQSTASASALPAATECGGMAKGDKPATVAATSSEPAVAAAGCGGCGGGGEAGGCGGGETGVASADAAKVAHFGAAFTVNDTQPLAAVLAKSEKTSDKLVRVKGKIDAVCQKKGCWLVVTDGAMKARIKMKDYGFTVPINSKGKEAVVEGTVTVKVWNEKMVKHLEEDAGRDPAKVKGTRKEFLLTATAIDIRG